MVSEVVAEGIRKSENPQSITTYCIHGSDLKVFHHDLDKYIECAHEGVDHDAQITNQKLGASRYYFLRTRQLSTK